MAGNPRRLLRGQIRTLYDAGTATGLTDGQLLERFATRHGEGAELAFATLVERHGAMVLRACRGILRDDHEAMDAFQATFLVLVRKGGSLWVRDSLGPWLHRVACRAAGRARSSALRRRAAERRAAEAVESRNGGDIEELLSAVHEEIDRLPERYRSTVVLCDLEGRTCEEAARHLGCPVGTVGSRLSRGRRRLRDRLSRRGLAPRIGPAAGAVAWQGPLLPVPPELVGSTAGVAARFISTQAVSQGAAALLALGVLRSMAITRWWKVASVLLAVSASTTGVVSLAGRGAGVAEARPDDAPKAPRAEGVAVTEVKPGKLKVVVQERGRLEASQNTDVLSAVEGQSRIITIVPKGTKVTKGQLVCELDSSPWKSMLTNQMIPTKAAETAYEIAKGDRKSAEVAVTEYTDAVYPGELQAAEAEIALARSAIKRAEERLKRTRAAGERLNALLVERGGTKTSADVMAALDIEDRLDATEQVIDREHKALEIGQSKRSVLEKYTRVKTLKRLTSEVEKAAAIESAKHNTWEQERSKEERLNRQIRNCRILAPSDGTLTYAFYPDRLPGQQIGPGTLVQERQKILSIVDLDGPMRVVAKVHEAMVEQIKPGLVTRVKVDAFPYLAFPGVVELVASQPSINDFDTAYTTYISIPKRLPSFRPGLTATVEILVTELDNVLSVPMQAVVLYEGKNHVAVKTPDGGIDWREVTLGVTNGKVVEVKEGLKRGESVALEPIPLMSAEQKRKMPLAPTPPAAQPEPFGNDPGIPPAP